MIRCWPSVAKLYEPHEICENKVTIVNVKLKYRIDEDLTLNYSLREEFKSSTRDWIGIFPRNWLNLQQYLTFEYTLSSPPNTENPLNRTITFPRIFHREASPHLDYQFVYVSREIQIMAISSYFRFTPSLNNNETQHFPSSNNPSPCVGLISNDKHENYDHIDEIRCDDNSLLSLNNNDDPASLKIIEKKSITNRLRQTCQYCHRKICGLKIDALRGDFLASFSDSLLDRVRRLERDLSLAESNVKSAKNSREKIAKRLRAYEAFVTEMLSSVDSTGIVRITNEKGKEIVLQRLKENNSSVLDDTRKYDLLKSEIVDLRSIIEKQEKTIACLMKEKNFNLARRDRIKFIHREVQTSDPSETIESSKSHEKKVIDENEKISSNKIEPRNNENSYARSNEIETLKISSEDINSVTSKCSNDRRVLKNPKPSGILVHGKNVKFAIVRF